MKTLDITFDLETCSLAPTAAVMSIGAVAWNRKGKDTPFFTDEEGINPETCFSAHVDLRSMFVDGFTFDQDTANFWAKQSNEAKSAVLANDNGLASIQDIINDFFDWILSMKKDHNADEVCLWSQGSDFDIAILKNICHKYNKEIPVRYTNFRDHRTFFLEMARLIIEGKGEDFDYRKAYALVQDYKGEGAAHDPMFDCKRSIFSTWQITQQAPVPVA